MSNSNATGGSELSFGRRIEVSGSPSSGALEKFKFPIDETTVVAELEICVVKKFVVEVILF